MVPAVWLIIIAVSVPGGIDVQQVPFTTVEACEATVDVIRQQRPDWTRGNVIMVCAPSGNRV